MGVAQKFLYGAVGLLVTVLLIQAGLSVYRRAKNASDYLAQEQDRNLAETKEYNLVKYDGYTINGSTAINYIKTAVTDYGAVVYIKKGSGASATTGTIRYTSDFTVMRDVTSAETYVNPLKEYKCTVRRDANGAFVSVDVEEQ